MDLIDNKEEIERFSYDTTQDLEFIETETIVDKEDLKIYHKTTKDKEKYFHVIKEDIEILYPLEDVELIVEGENISISIKNLPEEIIERLNSLKEKNNKANLIKNRIIEFKTPANSCKKPKW